MICRPEFREEPTGSGFLAQFLDRDVAELHRIGMTGKAKMAAFSVFSGMRAAGHKVFGVRQIGVEDFRPVVGHQCVVGGFAPESITDARTQAPGTSSTLIG